MMNAMMDVVTQQQEIGGVFRNNNTYLVGRLAACLVIVLSIYLSVDRNKCCTLFA